MALVYRVRLESVHYWRSPDLVQGVTAATHVKEALNQSKDRLGSTGQSVSQ